MILHGRKAENQRFLAGDLCYGQSFQKLKERYYIDEDSSESHICNKKSH